MLLVLIESESESVGFPAEKLGVVLAPRPAARASAVHDVVEPRAKRRARGDLTVHEDRHGRSLELFDDAGGGGDVHGSSGSVTRSFHRDFLQSGGARFIRPDPPGVFVHGVGNLFRHLGERLLEHPDARREGLLVIVQPE